MSTLSLLAQVSQSATVMPKIIFWVLLVLWAIGAWSWSDDPRWHRGSAVVLIILLAILGFYTFRF